MPNISDNHQCDLFLAKLRICERNVSRMSDWEQKFVGDIREKFESREDAFDLGLTPWSPSANQWNTLSLLAEEYA
jgi:hypothetical protein